MFDKFKQVTMIVRFKNSYHTEIGSLVDTYKSNKTVTVGYAISSEEVELMFDIRKYKIKQFKQHLDLLKLVGVRAEVKEG